VAEGARIIALVGTGPEGTRYLAQTPDGRRVRLHVLSTNISPERRAEIVQRVRVLQATVAPELMPVLDARLEGDRSVVVMAVDDYPTLAERIALHGPPTPERSAAIALGLLRAVRRAHRLGLAHGAIRPTELLVRDDGCVILDLTGLRTIPQPGSEPATLERDVADTGAIVSSLLDAFTLAPELQNALAAMCDPDPQVRPPIGQALRMLSPALVKSATSANEQAPKSPEAGETLGRFTLIERIGKGANGEVFRAEVIGVGTGVAIKVLKPDAALDEIKLLRFRREARVLAEVYHPNIANLIEVNEDRGIMFIATELVIGSTLETYKRANGKLPEKEAIRIVAEVAKALVVAHDRGVVHRDVKPDNIMLGTKADPKPDELAFYVRLCDFGIAHWGEDDENLTAEMVVGTPRFMAPEQCTGVGAVTPATDVYALGLVLFDLVTGARPFAATGSRDLMIAQIEESPRRADEVAPTVGKDVADFIARCLSKEPANRPPNARAFVEEALAVLGGGPREGVHPPLPSGGGKDVLEAAYQWQLKASPQALWRFVSDTERLNRALGLPAVDWSFSEDDDGIALFGAAVQVGLKVKWRERPYEWIEGQRLGVLREYSEGPLQWYVSAVELVARPDGGTTLTHRLWLKPRASMWKPVVWIEVKQRLKGKLDRLYRRLSDVALLPEGSKEDAFEAPRDTKRGERRRLEALIVKLREDGVTERAGKALEEVLSDWPDQAVARLRPIPIARKYGVPDDEMIEACLVGASIGLLLPLWDVICPTCRVPTKVVDSLSAVREHMDCEVCRASFQVDAASSIELVFRAHPDIRTVELRTYCLGGPAHSPHAAAQIWLKAGERFRFEVKLEEGRYELRTTKDEWRVGFRVARGVGARNAHLVLTEAGLPPLLPALGEGKLSFTIENQCAQDRVVRLERSTRREDAFTGSAAAAHPTFQRLFPQQTLAPDTLVGLAAVSLLVTDVHGAGLMYETRGDAVMLGGLHRHLELLSALVVAGGGSVVKSAGHGVVAVFARIEDAVATAMEIASTAKTFPTVTAVHKGPAMMATVGGRIDYFGRAVVRVHGLLSRCAAGQVILSERVAEEGACEALWKSKGYESEVLSISAELGVEMAVRLRPPAQAGTGTRDRIAPKLPATASLPPSRRSPSRVGGS